MVAGVDRGKGTEGHVIRALAVLSWAGEGQLYNRYFAKTFDNFYLEGVEGHVVWALAVLSWAEVGRIDGQLYNKYFASKF